MKVFIKKIFCLFIIAIAFFLFSKGEALAQECVGCFSNDSGGIDCRDVSSDPNPNCEYSSVSICERDCELDPDDDDPNPVDPRPEEPVETRECLGCYNNYLGGSCVGIDVPVTEECEYELSEGQACIIECALTGEEKFACDENLGCIVVEGDDYQYEGKEARQRCVESCDWEIVSVPSCETSLWGVGFPSALGCFPFDPVKAAAGSNLFFLGIVGPIALVLLVKAAYLIITSQGSPEKIAEAKQIITAVISGVLMLIFAVFILRLIGSDLLNLF